MACTCTDITRGGWQGGGRAITWGVSSKCDTKPLEVPDEFHPSGEIVALGDASRRRTQDSPQQQAGTGQVGGVETVQTCCVTYKIGWRVAGLAPNEQVIVNFNAGDDGWGPFRSGGANQQGVAEDFEEVSVCKEHADCSKQKVGKLTFDRIVGAGQPTRIGVIGDIELCKLR